MLSAEYQKAKQDLEITLESYMQIATDLGLIPKVTISDLLLFQLSFCSGENHRGLFWVPW